MLSGPTRPYQKRRVKTLLIAMVTTIAMMVIAGEDAKSDQFAAIRDVEIFMKKDTACKWPPLAGAFIHNENTTSRIRTTITMTNNAIRSDELNPGETRFIGCWSPSDPNNPGYTIVDAVYF
jgi:hypothetical protein